MNEIDKKKYMSIINKNRNKKDGKKDKDGHFPAGTVNYLVYEKLKKYAKVSYEK